MDASTAISAASSSGCGASRANRRRAIHALGCHSLAPAHPPRPLRTPRDPPGAGLYTLARDPEKIDALRQIIRRDFVWLRPPSCP